MMLLQFRFENTSDDEQDLIPDFCEWLCTVLFTEINTRTNRKKISLRMDYLLNKVQWINWHKNKYNISVSDIMQSIAESITYEQYRKNTWKIKIDMNVLIPYSNTSIDRLVRFLNYGDAYQRATGIFTKVITHYKHSKLNTLWSLYCNKCLGIGLTDSKIISI